MSLEAPKKKSAIYSIFTFKCPTCREYPAFENPNPYAIRDMFKMNKTCAKCGQNFEPEPGFYWGAMYVAYALSSGIVLVGFAVLFFAVGLSFNQSLLVDMLVLLLLVPFTFRLSRSLWLHLFASTGRKKQETAEVD